MKLKTQKTLNKKWVEVLWKGASLVQNREDMIKLNFTILNQPEYEVPGRSLETSILIWNPIKLNKYNEIRKWMGLAPVLTEGEVDIPLVTEMDQDWAQDWNKVREAYIESSGEKGYLNITNMRAKGGIVDETNAKPY